jgi:hypothetical protein
MAFPFKPFLASQLRSLVETLANSDKISRFTDLERAEPGDVKPPRLGPEGVPDG